MENLFEQIDFRSLLPLEVACGMRLYEITAAVTVLSLLVLTVLNPLDRRIHQTRNKAKET